jgi:hypothetical protein
MAVGAGAEASAGDRVLASKQTIEAAQIALVAEDACAGWAGAVRPEYCPDPVHG